MGSSVLTTMGFLAVISFIWVMAEIIFDKIRWVPTKTLITNKHSRQNAKRETVERKCRFTGKRQWKTRTGFWANGRR